jgi:hypothetical protein
VGSSPQPFVLAEAARSECAPSTRAMKGSWATPHQRETSELGGEKEGGLLISCARGTRPPRRKWRGSWYDLCGQKGHLAAPFPSFSGRGLREHWRPTGCHHSSWLCVSILISQQGGLVDPRLRATFSPAHPLARQDVPLAQASTFRSCVFREQEDD